MTKQEAFNKVWQYFVVEKHPRSIMMSLYQCVNLTPEGDKCAAACLIDEDILKSFGPNGGTIDQVNQYLSNKGLSINFINKLRSIHDCYDLRADPSFTNYMIYSLNKFADNNNLEVPNG